MEEHDGSMALRKVARCADIPPEEARSYECDGKTIAIFNVEGKHYALDGVCPHREGPLGEGLLEGKIVTCPWHGWRFDVTTGQSPEMPAAKVRQYVIAVAGEDLWVEID